MLAEGRELGEEHRSKLWVDSGRLGNSTGIGLAPLHSQGHCTERHGLWQLEFCDGGRKQALWLREEPHLSCQLDRTWYPSTTQCGSIGVF